MNALHSVETERPRLEPLAKEITFVCANPDHHLLAARREGTRLHDHRFRTPEGRIPAHDYCGVDERSETIWFRGRPALCPLGTAVDDHEWRESEATPSSRREGAVRH
jgi:hypothetical protein